MKKGFKIRLLPTEQQKELMFKSIGCSRFTYNWALNRCNELYKQGVKYNMSNIRKEFTQLKKQESFKWLNEVSNTTMVESMRNLDKAFKIFFKTKKAILNLRLKENQNNLFMLDMTLYILSKMYVI